MKFTLIAIMSFFTAFFASAQTNKNGEKVMTQISGLYNKEAYHQMFLMHDPSLKYKIPEDQLTSFYKNSIEKPYGKIISWEYTDTKDGEINYTVQLYNGVLNLSFSLNNKNEITGIKWLPHKDDKKIIKRDISTINFDNPKETKLQLLIDSLALDYLQDSANCGLSIGIVNEDKNEMFFYGSNYKDADVLPGMRTLYEIGSITKTFTATLLAHAINEGKLKPDDDIRQYLPGKYPNLQYKGTPITIQDLSNHTSRLPRIPANLGKQPGYDKNDPYKNYSQEMIYAYLKKVKIDTLPGSVCEYSNLGVALLGIILENVYQQPLEALIKSYVTQPAKMDYTKFLLSQSEKNKMAIGFDGTDGTEAANWNLGAFNAAGGLKSNMEDMLNYLIANMNEINPDFKLAHRQTFKDINMAIGLDWIINNTPDGQTQVWHNGKTAGYSSYIGFIKEKKVGVIILSNSNTSVDNISQNILREMSNEK